MDFIVPYLGHPLPEVVKEYERLKEQSRVIEMEDAKEGKGDKWKKKYDESMEKLALMIYTNSLGLGEQKVSKTKMAEAMGIGIKKFDQYLIRSAESEKERTERAQEESKNPRAPE